MAAQSVKDLLCNHEDPNSGPDQPCQKQSTLVHVCNPSAGETGRFLMLTTKLRNKTGERLKSHPISASGVYTSTSHTHAHADTKVSCKRHNLI